MKEKIQVKIFYVYFLPSNVSTIDWKSHVEVSHEYEASLTLDPKVDPIWLFLAFHLLSPNVGHFLLEIFYNISTNVCYRSILFANSNFNFTSNFSKNKHEQQRTVYFQTSKIQN